MEVTVNVFNTVSHCMSVYLLSFGNVAGVKRGAKRRGGEVGKVSNRDVTQAIMDLILLLSVQLSSNQLIPYLLVFIVILLFLVASLFTYNLLFKAISRSNYIDSKWEKAQVGLRVV